ncbi:hypothetical protein IMF27_27860 [Pseudomonas sp. PCH199]|uniref:hypothetical protein n=1 Tax=unclassified Pseudomonas TaxID=196821 RepID=UPI000BDB7B20|nr:MULTISPECIES: hypothetical protein [unclassified Pseudomonas]MCW8278860.1 hypothetical protein [Pseudomonas sp. PCH199]PAM80968.1 hypothetical protein CES87_28490 [Pseudomonas sp. ERMR1:02]
MAGVGQLAGSTGGLFWSFNRKTTNLAGLSWLAYPFRAHHRERDVMFDPGGLGESTRVDQAH